MNHPKCMYTSNLHRTKVEKKSIIYLILKKNNKFTKYKNKGKATTIIINYNQSG